MYNSGNLDTSKISSHIIFRCIFCGCYGHMASVGGKLKKFNSKINHPSTQTAVANSCICEQGRQPLLFAAVAATFPDGMVEGCTLETTEIWAAVQKVNVPFQEIVRQHMPTMCYCHNLVIVWIQLIIAVSLFSPKMSNYSFNVTSGPWQSFSHTFSVQ